METSGTTATARVKHVPSLSSQIKYHPQSSPRRYKTVLMKYATRYWLGISDTSSNSQATNVIYFFLIYLNGLAEHRGEYLRNAQAKKFQIAKGE